MTGGNDVLFKAAVLWFLLCPSVYALTEQVNIEPQPGRVLPANMQFIDHRGVAVTLDHYLHKGPVLLAPVWFRCRKICDFTLSELAKSLQMMDAYRDIPVIAVSIDPDESATDGLRQQQRLQKQFPGLELERIWHFLTASEQVIQTLSEYAGFHFRYSESLQQYMHPVATLVLAPDGSISSYLYGMNHQPEQLQMQLRQAQRGYVEPAMTNILLLLCYHYDATAGRYTLSIIKVLNLSALLSVVLLVGFLVRSYCREKYGK